MKSITLLSVVVLSLAMGCATPPRHITPVSRGAVRDIDISYASFGSGTKVADVTDRVIELLRTEAAGFEARANVLGTDPLPYHSKCLIIDYSYQDKRYRFAVANKHHVSYELLLKNTKP